MNSSDKTPKHGLGRGLGALIVNTDESPNPASPEVIAQAEAGGVQMLSIERIAANPHQPRTHFDEDLLTELALSIREHGIIQPLIVTAARDLPDHFWIVAGERRWRAAQLADLAQVPVIIREASPQQLMEWALVENVQRADLNPLEEATAYVALMDEFHLTQANVAKRVGKSRSAIANTIRLLQLPPSIQAAIISGTLSAGHARTLLALESPEEMEEAASVIQQRALNVRQAEELVRKLLTPSPAASETVIDEEAQAQLAHLEDRFRSSLGTRVNLNRNPDGSGRLVVHFYGDDDLQALYRRMVGDDEL
jgi:ParB family chromosome partitioning protein